MKKIIHKTFFAWDFEKEEKWLNAMAAKGLNLTDASPFRYVFEEGTPGEYQYRLEFLENLPTHPESQQYIHFMEETGVDHIASIFRWVYFRKKATEEPFDLYSDIDSRIKHLARINTFFIPFMVLEFGIGINNLLAAIFTGNSAPAVICVILFLFGLLFAYGVFKVTRSIKRLKKERDIHE